MTVISTSQLSMRNFNLETISLLSPAKDCVNKNTVFRSSYTLNTFPFIDITELFLSQFVG